MTGAAVGALIAIVAQIWLLILMMQGSSLWILALFVPFLTWIFAAENWEEASRPFYLHIAGTVLTVICLAAGS